MKHTVLGISVLVVGMLVVLPARANQCHGGHTDDKSVEKTEPKTTEASGKEIKLQTICPVMGGAIDKALYVDHDGKRIYVCCQGCIATVKKDPAKYIKKLEDTGVTVATLQTQCPVMGGAIDKALYVDHDGKRIYVCCQGCIATVKKDPAKYIKKLEDTGVTVATLQTQCPVMGGAIDKALYVDHDGKRIYVCCQGCVAEVGKDPAKYIKSMEAAGVALHTAGVAGKAAEPKKPAAGHEGHRH